LDEIEDNIITFIGAGHETTARALGWTLYCLANSPGGPREGRGGD
jgi:cytochrome P450